MQRQYIFCYMKRREKRRTCTRKHTHKYKFIIRKKHNNIVVVSATAHLFISGIYNCLFPLYIPDSLRPQEAPQVVTVLYLVR